MDSPAPTPPTPYIPGISAPPRQSMALRILLFTAAIVVILAGGLYINTTLNSRAEVKAVAEAEAAYTAQILTDDTKIAAAIAGRKVLFGMTRSEVRMSKGDPERMWDGAQVPETLRERGCVEMWLWSHPHVNGRYHVAFNKDGLAMSCTDFKDLSGVRLEDITVRRDMVGLGGIPGL